MKQKAKTYKKEYNWMLSFEPNLWALPFGFGVESQTNWRGRNELTIVLVILCFHINLEIITPKL
jgi:hypothetical protein